MRFLTPDQWQAWCLERQVPLREAGSMRPDLGADHFHIALLPHPPDSVGKVRFAHQLVSLVASESESLLLVDDWDVWPSSRHLPLFTRFREALGERRPLLEAPGHVVTRADEADAISIVALSLLFLWDCYGISSTGRDAFYISHDEHCYFASRDSAVAERVTAEFAAP